jgi:glycosyl hydrolase family 43
MKGHPERRSVPSSAAAGVGPAAAPAGASTGPAYPGDAADPFVLNVDGDYYAFITQVPDGSGGWLNVPVLRSSDGLGGWTPQASPADALPQLPWWAKVGNTWAPAVARTGASSFVMYYTVTDAATGMQAISRASSSVPGGPYADDSSTPMVFQKALGGSIDPQPLRAPGGQLFLHWKSDDNRFRNPTTLWGRRLSADGLSFEQGSKAHSLLHADAAWEGGVIEGPVMTAVADHGRRGGYRYFLLYGGGDWASPAAGMGYAVCEGPLGPCRKATVDSPWLGTGTLPGRLGPAGPDFYALGSSSPYAATQQLAYHGWFCPPGTVCDPPTGYSGGAVRALWIDTVSFSGRTPTLAS